jgi:hypothetical protein
VNDSRKNLGGGAGGSRADGGHGAASTPADGSGPEAPPMQQLGDGDGGGGDDEL